MPGNHFTNFLLCLLMLTRQLLIPLQYSYYCLMSKYNFWSLGSNSNLFYRLGANSSTLGLYCSPSIRYFGDEYLPYAILAVIILALLVFVPIIILFLYTFLIFQKFLSLFPFNWHFLHAVVDSVQGCYKDGTEPGTFDYCCISVLIILIQLVLAIISIHSVLRIIMLSFCWPSSWWSS